MDKTQVYSFEENDHITHRALHVQLVSKIARTIGRSLKLNEDLIEAVSLGHDLGHSPFGHKGENILNEICEEENLGYFCHNAQSVKILKDVEKRNMTVQTLDGILAHNGELLLGKYVYEPNKTKEDFLRDLESVYSIKDYSRKIRPMTLEAAVVRVSDVIAYIGRDIEDAIIVGSVKREDLPEEIINVLGNNNSKIVDTLIRDVIINSMYKPYIAFSSAVFENLNKLKDWNMSNIYQSKEANRNYDDVERMMKKLFYKYVEVFFRYPEEIEEMTKSERALFRFVKHMEKGTDENKIKIAIIDYIAGQTDRFFLRECINFEI
ncbi:MAG: HD domain-containing protein [Oscillospiraceae bacterium]|nr:HD domain-containing protein [Oscillospiraceae bacterium]